MARPGGTFVVVLQAKRLLAHRAAPPFGRKGLIASASSALL
jgi:hypothetical protein